MTKSVLDLMESQMRGGVRLCNGSRARVSLFYTVVWMLINRCCWSWIPPRTPNTGYDHNKNANWQLTIEIVSDEWPQPHAGPQPHLGGPPSGPPSGPARSGCPWSPPPVPSCRAGMCGGGLTAPYTRPGVTAPVGTVWRLHPGLCWWLRLWLHPGLCWWLRLWLSPDCAGDSDSDSARPVLMTPSRSDRPADSETIWLRVLGIHVTQSNEQVKRTRLR